MEAGWFGLWVSPLRREVWFLDYWGRGDDIDWTGWWWGWGGVWEETLQDWGLSSRIELTHLPAITSSSISLLSERNSTLRPKFLLLLFKPITSHCCGPRTCLGSPYLWSKWGQWSGCALKRSWKVGHLDLWHISTNIFLQVFFLVVSLLPTQNLIPPPAKGFWVVSNYPQPKCSTYLFLPDSDPS